MKKTKIFKGVSFVASIFIVCFVITACDSPVNSEATGSGSGLGSGSGWGGTPEIGNGNTTATGSITNGTGSESGTNTITIKPNSSSSTDISLKFKKIEASTKANLGSKFSHFDPHTVSISEYWIGETEVTQELW